MNSSRRDLLVRVAPRDQPKHFAFARRQLIEFRVERGGGAPGPAAACPLRQRQRHRARTPPAAARKPPRLAPTRFTAVDQLGRGDRLRDVAPRAGANDGDHVLRRVRGREREKPHLRVGRPQRRDDRLAAATWQVHVEQDDIGLERGDQRDRGLDVVSLADDLDRRRRARSGRRNETARGRRR